MTHHLQIITLQIQFITPEKNISALFFTNFWGDKLNLQGDKLETTGHYTMHKGKINSQLADYQYISQMREKIVRNAIFQSMMKLV